MQATPLDPSSGQPGEGISTLCLSCHDGTVALDSFGGGAPGGTIINGGVPGGANVTTNLTDDHPIAIPFNNALQPDMQDPAVATTAIGGTIADDLLFGGRVECASCHDVHNAGLGTTKLLVLDNDASNLCQTCHLK
jgi:predicted CXXCH cytochrome family protein